MGKAMRAAIYSRVSTDAQTTANQREALEAVSAQRGWTIVATYEDAGISGAKGRDKRPGLDAALKDASRGKFDVLMVWAVDRIGRSLPDLIGTLQELHGAKVDLFLHQQAIDTTTPAGRAMFGMLSVFSEFERSMIQARVKAGLARARAETPEQRRAKDKLDIGRPRIANEREAAIRAALATGAGVHKVARQIGVGSGTVRRVRGEAMAQQLANGAT